MSKNLRSAPFGMLVYCLFSLVAVVADARATYAQTGEIEEVVYLSEDEFKVVRRLTCPLGLRGGLSGWLFGYPHAGKTWTPDWDRVAVLEPVSYSQARYNPQAWDGYAAGKGNYIEAWYFGNARWY